MEHPFIQYLIDRDLVTTKVVDRLKTNRNHIREPIGMIAVHHGLIDIAQIDVILDEQSNNSSKLFGEIAVDKGFLTTEQVDQLVKIQDLRIPLDVAEILSLSGVLSCEDAARYLGAFFLQDQEVDAMISEA